MIWWNLRRMALAPWPALLLLGAMGLVASGCRIAPANHSATPSRVPASLSVRSKAFSAGQPIPVRYTCDGGDISPPLEWGDVPAGVASFTLIMDDPDAPGGTWTHWVLYDLPADVHSLSENVAAVEYPSEGGVHGKNSWNRIGYGGPCPPSGTHRYVVKLYALDVALALAPGATVGQVQKAMQGHVMAYGELIGTYRR